MRVCAAAHIKTNPRESANKTKITRHRAQKKQRSARTEVS